MSARGTNGRERADADAARRSGDASRTRRAGRIRRAFKATFDAGAYIADDGKAEIRVCAGTACHASGRAALRTAIDKALADRGLTDKVAVVETGCHGFCEEGPSWWSARRACSTHASHPRTWTRSSPRAS